MGKMNHTERRIEKRKLLFAGLTFLTILIILYIAVRRHQMSWSDLLRYTPQNKFLAGLVFQGFYALKSLTVFFPLPVIQLAAGHLFSTGGSLTVNLCGIFVATSIPYFIGWHLGEPYTARLVEKYDAVEKIVAVESDNVLFSTYMIRMLQLPLDLVSLFLGSQHLDYWQYMAGNMLGLLPETIGMTLIGETIHDPSSPQFWYSLAFMALMIVVSILIFHRYQQHHQKKNASGI